MSERKSLASAPVGEYRPTMYGFNGYKKGIKPADHELPARR